MVFQSVSNLVAPTRFELVSPCLKGKFPSPLEEDAIGCHCQNRTGRFRHVKATLYPMS